MLTGKRGPTTHTEPPGFHKCRVHDRQKGSGGSGETMAGRLSAGCWAGTSDDRGGGRGGGTLGPQEGPGRDHDAPEEDLEEHHLGVGPRPGPRSTLIYPDLDPQRTIP